MTREIRIFFTALMFYTRIPCPSWSEHDPSYLEKSTRYFPLIGIIVGSVAFGAYYVSSLALPVHVAVIISMIISLLTTGAFHEDGLADVCDGFGGGWSKEKILEIMKDSRIGTYGAVGLVMILLLKLFLLIELSTEQLMFVFLAFVTSHAISRLTATWMIAVFDYAREDAASKAKPIAMRISAKELVIASLTALLPLIILCLFFNPWFLLVLMPSPLLVWYLGSYFRRWIGGYTGDCLGAVQQISEVFCYIAFVVIW